MANPALKFSSIFDPNVCKVGNGVIHVAVLPQAESHHCLVTKYDPSVLELIYFDAGATHKVVAKLEDVINNVINIIPLIAEIIPEP